MSSRLIEIFEDRKLVNRIKNKLPYLFQLAELESSRAGKIGMEVGSLRAGQNIKQSKQVKKSKLAFYFPISCKIRTGIIRFFCMWFLLWLFFLRWDYQRQGKMRGVIQDFLTWCLPMVTLERDSGEREYLMCGIHG